MEMEELVKKARQGDQRAAEILCRQFSGLMQKAARQHHLRMIAEDALSAAYEGFAEAIRDYRFGCGVPFAGYAKSKVRFAVWNLFKRERRRWQYETALESPAEREEGGIGEIADPADVAAAVEAKLLLEQAGALLCKLPEKQRRIMLMTAFEEKTLSQAAVIMGITPQAAHALKQRAVNFMKKHKDLAP